MSKKQKRTYTVHHPRLAGVVRSGLTAAQRDRHHAYGWLDAPPLTIRTEALPPGVLHVVNDTGEDEPLATADELGD